MESLKVSVIVTTYNGEKFIVEQLESIRKQTKTPNEVLIFDDGSTDRTVDIIIQYIDAMKLKNWKLTKNKKNKGWRLNFIDGMKEAMGDLVFPCDQDDVWRPYKIEEMSKVMEMNSNMKLLVGKAKPYYGGRIVADENGKDEIFKKIQKRKFDIKYLRLEPGCAMCIRKSFFNTIVPYWFPELQHDALVAYFALISDSYYCYDRIVIDWRKYEGSTSHHGNRTKKIRMDELMLDNKVIDMLYTYNEKISNNNQVRKILLRSRRWNRSRREIVENKKYLYLIPLLCNLQLYGRKRAFLTDIMYSLM